MLDASFLSHALIPSQRFAEAERQLLALLDSERRLFAPHFVQTEFLSAVRRLEVGKRLTPTDAADTEAAFWSLSIEFGWKDLWVVRALEIARSAGLSTIYDAI